MVRRGMTHIGPTLFDEVCARLPLFDGLSEDDVGRLAADGFGRGLLTASLRARLRKAGYADMAALALASPAELTTVRKIGPVRVAAIRAHLVAELARRVAGARTDHETGATARRRLDRLRTVPLARLPLEAALIERLDRIGPTCADLAGARWAEIAPALGLSATDQTRLVTALARTLPSDRPRLPPPPDHAGTDAGPSRAALLRERDREWDAAAPPPRTRQA